MDHVKRVLIVGAGPVGLTAALALAQRGVATLVLEKREGLSKASKASTFHAPTLEILKEFGILDDMLERGELVERIQYRHLDGTVFAEFRHEMLRGLTQCPYRIHLEQSAITPLLLDRLRASGLSDVRFNIEVVDAGNDHEGAWVRMRDIDGSEDVLHAEYVLGADGAHSPVRKALGIGFEGTAYPGRVLRLMVENDLASILPGVAPVAYLFAAANRSLSLLKMPDCWRIIIRVPSGTSDETALAPDWYRPIVAEFIPGLESELAIKGLDVYGASKMVAERFGEGRVFLIGDSTHLTNTRGGMNMNCGIHDAYAMADAISGAMSGGGHGLVAAASLARQKVATEQLIPRTDRNVSGEQSWLDTVAQTAVDPRLAVDYMVGMAMLDIAPPRTLASLLEKEAV